MQREVAQLWSLAVFILASVPTVAIENDYLDLSLEELLNVNVFSASKFPQSTLAAPSAVSVVTAEEIRTYGYRSLDQILNSVRGLYTTYDRNYSYLGVSGFGRKDGLNSRFLLLIDGYRINDAIYENAAIGTDLPLDVELIDRVEIVRGPGSSIYGSNAFLGVINVITKRGRSIDGLEFLGSGRNLDRFDTRATYGKRYDSGLEVLLSGSLFRSDGQETIVFPVPDIQTPEKNFGRVERKDKDRGGSVRAELAYGDWSFFGSYLERNKGVPTASFGSMINQRNDARDRKLHLGLAYAQDIIDWLELSARVSYGQNRFRRESFYDRVNEDLPPFTLNVDRTQGDWWGAETQLTGERGRHHFVAGVEFRHNYRQDRQNVDRDPFLVYFDEHRSSTIWGVYLQDEVRLFEQLALNVGVRYDDYSTFGDTINPRVALIYTPRDDTAFKLLYGTAYRAPSEWERGDGLDRIANNTLRPEKITTYQGVLEHYLRPNFRVTAVAYYNELRDLSELFDDDDLDVLVYRSGGRADTIGAEFEGERVWDSGGRVRASYSWQRTEDRRIDSWAVNSPRHLAKLNLSYPFLQDRVRAAAEIQYSSRQKTLRSGTADEVDPSFIHESADAYILANASVLWSTPLNGIDLSFNVYNLFDSDIDQPAATEHDQNVIRQDGRTFRLQLTYRFNGFGTGK